MKCYRGYRMHGRCVVLVDGVGLARLGWHASFFAWGYVGVGPAELALSLLADYYGERPTRQELVRRSCRCWRPHQDFQRTILAPLPRDQRVHWELTSRQITLWLEDWLAVQQPQLP